MHPPRSHPLCPARTPSLEKTGDIDLLLPGCSGLMCGEVSVVLFFCVCLKTHGLPSCFLGQTPDRKCPRHSPSGHLWYCNFSPTVYCFVGVGVRCCEDARARSGRRCVFHAPASLSRSLILNWGRRGRDTCCKKCLLLWVFLLGRKRDLVRVNFV